ncbi:MAG: hypothetical protein COT84_03805 [Chlamydiae bacterium CG10_big_fil_rev_8_21_14_0_10_35_9]|nr:MAG: hypothetical protein COT84_03805 [Chlamydiae bacterium CG10_big_fil_rev_8_21_14_0_10_35_9]
MEQSGKEQDIIHIHEALENLSSIAELDVNSEKMVGVVKNHKFVLSDEESSYKTVHWLTPETAEEVIENVKQTFKTILEYLKNIYENEGFDWENPNNRKGLQAVMTLSGEAANKLDAYIDNLNTPFEIPRITESKQFTDLQEFYTKNLSQKMDLKLSGDSAWSEDWSENENILAVDTEKKGLKDFETVRRDKEYELFYLRNEYGHPFFNSSLLRNIKLVCDFDEMVDVSIEDDPLLKIRTMQDRDLHGVAQQILMGCESLTKEFFKLARGKTQEVFQYVHRAIMALMLTSNPKNLIQNTLGKSSLLYFNDFQTFLKKALNSKEYKRWLSYPPKDSDKAASVTLKLVHLLILIFFTRKESVKEEVIGLIHYLIEKGNEIKPQKKAKVYSQTIWNEFLVNDDNIRTLLKCYPNGPLFKVLDIIRSDEASEKEIAFDPIHQENYPYSIYNLNSKKKSYSFIRLPCPTRQSMIKSASIIEEFQNLVRNFSSQEKTYLIFNFQDRSSWKDIARVDALEKFSRQAEISQALKVYTLTKDSDFYYQTDIYFNMTKAEEFMQAFHTQLVGEQENGFYFGMIKKKENFFEKLEHLISFVHDVFFDKVDSLDRKMRLDFIEIFYHLFYLEMMEYHEPSYVSFVCKDAVDTSNATNASFYAFINLVKTGKLEKKEKDILLWLYYRPALLVRERSITPARLNRTLSFLDYVDMTLKEKKRKKLLEKYPLLNENDITS